MLYAVITMVRAWTGVAEVALSQMAKASAITALTVDLKLAGVLADISVLSFANSWTG
tara:strand:- start:2084 stop:2254 length:171 start_codon:yes stop_codon:yes gene_type:complete